MRLPSLLARSRSEGHIEEIGEICKSMQNRIILELSIGSKLIMKDIWSSSAGRRANRRDHGGIEVVVVVGAASTDDKATRVKVETG